MIFLHRHDMSHRNSRLMNVTRCGDESPRKSMVDEWMNPSGQIWKKITNLDLPEIEGVPIALTFHHQLGAQVTRLFGRYNLSLPTVTASEPGHPWWKCWGRRVSTTVPPKSRWFLRWPKKKRSQIEINCQVCQPLRVWNSGVGLVWWGQ